MIKEYQKDDELKFRLNDFTDKLLSVEYIANDKARPKIILSVMVTEDPDEIETETETEIKVDMFYYGKAQATSVKMLKALGFNGKFKTPEFHADAFDYEKNPLILKYSPYEDKNGVMVSKWSMDFPKAVATDKDLDELSSIFAEFQE